MPPGTGNAGADASRLAEAIEQVATSMVRTAGLINQAVATRSRGTDPRDGEKASAHRPDKDPGDVDAGADEHPQGDQQPTSLLRRARPSTRQAIQVAVASSAAIVAGELLSSARW